MSRYIKTSQAELLDFSSLAIMAGCFGVFMFTGKISIHKCNQSETLNLTF